MDPFVVIALDEFHKMVDEPPDGVLADAVSVTVSDEAVADQVPVTNANDVAVDVAVAVTNGIANDVADAVDVAVTNGVADANANTVAVTVTNGVADANAVTVTNADANKRVAFAYPSPVLAFIKSKRQYVILFFLVGIVTLRHKQLRKMLSQ